MNNLKIIIPMIILVLGLFLFSIGRFFMSESMIADIFVRIGGIMMLIGIVTTTYSIIKSKKQ